MKTNQVMTRDNGFVQRTKDGYFNANILLNHFNDLNPSTPKILGNYNAIGTTNDFIAQLKLEGIDKPLIAGRGRYGGSWMHPKLFIDFAMWLSVEFKSVVIDYVLDGLILSRHDAGDYFKEMCATILVTHIEYFGAKPNPNLYINEANIIKGLLYLVDTDRNDMTEKELSNVTQLQKLNSMLLRDRVGKDSRLKQLKLQARLLTE